MESSHPRGAISTVEKSLIDELTQGHASSNMLRVMLHNTTRNDLGCDSMIFAQNLIKKMLDSIDNSLSILNCSQMELNEAYNVPFNNSSRFDNGTMPEDMRRRKRRRRSLDNEITKVSRRAVYEDGHAWRKYGQKPICGAKHSRSYFRCTYKTDQGCQATKTVQKIQDDPPLFETLYHGDHTCKNLFTESEVIIMQDNTTTKDSPIMWSFNAHEFNHKPNDMVGPIPPTTGEETYKENVQDLPQDKSSSLPFGYFMSHDDLMALESFGHFTDFSSQSDHREHVVCSHVDIETLVGSNIFDDYPNIW